MIPQEKIGRPEDGVIMLNSDMVLSFPIDVTRDPVLLSNIGIVSEYCSIGAVSGGNGIGCTSSTKAPKIIPQTGALTPGAAVRITFPKFGTPIANDNFAQVLAYTGGTLGIGAVGTKKAGEFALHDTPASVANANKLFLADFAVSFTKMVNIGYSYPVATVPATANTNLVTIPAKTVSVPASRATKSGALQLLLGF